MRFDRSPTERERRTELQRWTKFERLRLRVHAMFQGTVTGRGEFFPRKSAGSSSSPFFLERSSRDPRRGRKLRIYFERKFEGHCRATGNTPVGYANLNQHAPMSNWNNECQAASQESALLDKHRVSVVHSSTGVTNILSQAKLHVTRLPRS